jgi:hypothetical protein
MYLVVAVIASGALLVSVSGCQKPTDSLSLAETTGTVTLDGKPLTSGTVTFVPDMSKGTTGPTGVGLIEKDGTFRIKTVRRDGALIGFHKIRVKSVDASKPGEPWVIPIEYDNPNRSGLTCEVKADQKNNVTLELKSNFGAQ